ncbi:MAG: heptaprenyl diphosphate synthase [Dehalococcoidales bacterium]|nr:heptaprenyl diphosphate synthase [Dehalococcoidales bacterium]
MLQLSAIYKPVREDLVKVEKELELVSKVDFPWLAELLGYSLKSEGKAIRPALTLLAGKLYHYRLDNLLPMAMATELLHVATLIHDDAIDKSPVRRSKPTVYKVWGEDKAVLLGDYLFAKAGELTTVTQNIRVVKLFTQTLRVIATGELAQIFDAYNLEQTYQQYIQRISNKTAALFILAVESGAVLSEAPEVSIKILNEYGYNLGIAFQIVDDILDFIGTEKEVGKPIGSDLAQGTLTLPSMLLLERYPEDNPVKRLFQNRDRQEEIKLAIEQVRDSSIIEECYTVASDYCDRACRRLILLPDNASRQSLTETANYVIRRKK